MRNLPKSLMALRVCLFRLNKGVGSPQVEAGTPGVPHFPRYAGLVALQQKNGGRGK